MEYDVSKNFGEVYKVLLKTYKCTKIAHSMGYTTTRQLYNSIEGKSMMSTRAISNLVQVFDVNPKYIFCGKGAMFLSQENEIDIKFNYHSNT